MSHPLDAEETFFVATKLCLKCRDEILVVSEIIPGFPTRRELPGGRITKFDKNLPMLHSLVREVREELGLSLSLDDSNTFLFQVEKSYETVTFQTEPFPFLFICYIHEVDSKPPITLSDEHSDYVWIQASEIDTFSDWRPGFDEIVRRAFMRK